MEAYIFWNDLTKEAQDRLKERFKPYIDIERSWIDFWTDFPMAVVKIHSDSSISNEESLKQIRDEIVDEALCGASKEKLEGLIRKSKELIDDHRKQRMEELSRGAE